MGRVPPHFFLSRRIPEGYAFYHEWEKECPARTVLADERWPRIEGDGGRQLCDTCRRLNQADGSATAGREAGPTSEDGARGDGGHSVRRVPVALGSGVALRSAKFKLNHYPYEGSGSISNHFT